MPNPIRLAVGELSFDGLEWGPSGGPAVLALHGFPQRCASWDAVARRLAERGVRTVAFDQRGYSPGARPLEVSAYALPRLIDDVAAMIDSIGAPAHLVGHDWGGVVGWQVAARRPDLVRTWTAVSTPHQQAIEDLLASSAEERERFGYIRGLRDPRAEGRLAADGWAPFAAIYGGALAADRLAAEVEFFRRPGALTAALDWYRAMDPRDFAATPPVAVPTTFVWGSEDVAFSRAAAARTERYVDGPYRFVPLEGASHWLPDEAPDAVAQAIAARVLGAA